MTSFVKILVLSLAVLGSCLGSSKKGVAINGGNSYHCGDENAFTNINWWYDWHSSPWEHNAKGCPNSLRSGYVPMVWGWRHNIDYPIHLQSGTQYVLGFNEPNFQSQSNLSPQQAASHWHSLESAANGRILVSPSAAPGGNPLEPVSWFEQFFQACGNCRVDHIATHGYWCNADTMMNYLQNLYNKFQKPIWLTEFSCPQHNSVDDQLNYMKAVLPRLEAASFVYRYAWFVSRTHGDGWIPQAASLLEQNGARLTRLGQYYNNF